MRSQLSSTQADVGRDREVTHTATIEGSGEQRWVRYEKWMESPGVRFDPSKEAPLKLLSACVIIAL